MTKQEFLSVLRRRLQELPPADVSRTVEYYSEMIDDHMENGRSEASAVAKMGDPNEVAAQILTGSSAKRGTKGQAAKKKSGRGKGWNIALLCLGFPLWFPLLVAAASIILAAVIVMWSLGIVVWALVVSFGVCCLAFVVLSPLLFVMQGVSAGLLLLGSGILLGGLAILCFLLGILTVRLLARATGAIFGGIGRVIFGRRG